MEICHFVVSFQPCFFGSIHALAFFKCLNFSTHCNSTKNYRNSKSIVTVCMESFARWQQQLRHCRSIFRFKNFAEKWKMDAFPIFSFERKVKLENFPRLRIEVLAIEFPSETLTLTSDLDLQSRESDSHGPYTRKRSCVLSSSFQFSQFDVNVPLHIGRWIAASMPVTLILIYRVGFFLQRSFCI